MNKTKILLAMLIMVAFNSCQDEEYDDLNQNSANLESKYSTDELKTIVITPEITGYTNATYTWLKDNQIISTEKSLAFVTDKEGIYDFTLQITDKSKIYTLTTQLIVNKAVSVYSKYISDVYDFLPAVGQFINKLPPYTDGDSKEAMIQKAKANLVGPNPTMISLGGYGGYVVFGFDHTIINKPNKRDFKILGNVFTGSHEPGIILVSYDKNNNGLPDDEWYEIAGSEYQKPETIKNYSITYFSPEIEPTIPTLEYIRWEDNQGNSGYKEKNRYHNQPYFPQWISQNSLTFTGTKLADNYVDQSGNGTYWVGKQLEYGYADNGANNSEISDIDIDWAVDKNGNKVRLRGIDFIKVYTGVNQEAGWLGEISTEVAGAYDLHL